MKHLFIYTIIVIFTATSCSYMDNTEVPGLFVKAAPVEDWETYMNWEDLSIRKGDTVVIEMYSYSTYYQPSTKIYFDVSVDDGLLPINDSLGSYTETAWSDNDFYSDIPEIGSATNPFGIKYIIHTKDLEPGTHTINITASDYYNAVATQNYTFNVVETNLPYAVVDSMRIQEYEDKDYDKLFVYVSYSATDKPVQEIRFYIDDNTIDYAGGIFEINEFTGHGYDDVYLHDSEVSDGEHSLKLEVIDEDFTIMMDEEYTFVK